MGKYTEEELERGFAEWLIRERTDDGQFLDNRQIAQLTPKEYGTLGAAYLIKLIRFL